MKENKGINTKIVNLKEYSSNEVGLLAQVVLIELLIIFIIINIITNIFMPVFYAIIVMLMLTMAYNNERIYKRKYMTPVYLIVGLFTGISALIEYLF